MSDPRTTENVQIRLAANVDTQSIEGHDRDCARAIWSQANLGERLSTVQVEHLLSIGARSGRAAALREVAAVLTRDHDMPPNKDRRNYGFRMGWWEGVHHAAKVAERAARALRTSPGVTS